MRPCYILATLKSLYSVLSEEVGSGAAPCVAHAVDLVIVIGRECGIAGHVCLKECVCTNLDHTTPDPSDILNGSVGQASLKESLHGIVMHIWGKGLYAIIGFDNVGHNLFSALTVYNSAEYHPRISVHAVLIFVALADKCAALIVPEYALGICSSLFESAPEESLVSVSDRGKSLYEVI